jgi:hypothetical protein
MLAWHVLPPEVAVNPTVVHSIRDALAEPLKLACPGHPKMLLMLTVPVKVVESTVPLWMFPTMPLGLRA